MLKLKSWIAYLLAGSLLLSACGVRETPVVTQTTTATTVTTVTTLAEARPGEDKFFENNEVYFWVEKTRATNGLIPRIGEMLNSSSGWARSGLKFIHTADKSKAHIYIYPKDSWKEVQRLCANVKDAAGCASQYTTIGGGYICSVKLRAPYDRLSAEGFLSILNHEIGHCLGVKHSNVKGDLMYWSANFRSIKKIIYPTDKDIAQIPKHLEYLKEIKKRLNR